jgi:hypothetical protein
MRQAPETGASHWLAHYEKHYGTLSPDYREKLLKISPVDRRIQRRLRKIEEMKSAGSPLSGASGLPAASVT